MHSSCPTCRAKFSIGEFPGSLSSYSSSRILLSADHTANLDLRYVPKKYHEFIKPSVQRVWLEIPSQEGLKSRVSELEKSLDVVHRDKQLLLAKCEQNLDAIRHHAEGERNARTEVEKAKKEASQLRKQLRVLKTQQKNPRGNVDNETL